MKTSLKIRTVASTFGLMAAAWMAVPAAQANLVLNGGFDANTPPNGAAPLDWTLTPAASGSDFFVGPGPGFGALSAPNSANFGATQGADDTLSQVLATAPGQSYRLDFFLAHNDSDTANDFSASWNGTTVLSLVNTATFGYTEYTYTVTATGAATTLAFSGRENPSWYDLDNVSVNSTTVPEPASLLLLGAGLAGFAVKRRYQRS